LLGDGGKGTAAGGVRLHAGGREHHGQADHQQQAGAGQQQVVGGERAGQQAVQQPERPGGGRGHRPAPWARTAAANASPRAAYPLNISRDAAAGASSTVSPGAARVAAARTTSPMAPSSVLATSTTGTRGACRASAAASEARSTPSSTTPTRRSATWRTRSVTSTPLSWPPATHTTRG